MSQFRASKFQTTPKTKRKEVSILINFLGIYWSQFGSGFTSLEIGGCPITQLSENPTQPTCPNTRPVQYSFTVILIIPLYFQIIYSNPGGFYPQAPSAISPLTAYPQPVDLTGPQRGAMYTQPSQVQSYHPYRRT